MTEGRSLSVEYAPHLWTAIHRPSGDDPAPVMVVMVPGGAWRTADPGGFGGLAEYLADHGFTALRIEIGAAEDGVRYPEPVEDIHCAVGYAAALAVEEGLDPVALILLGHSSGAHLAALAASTTLPISAHCPHDPALADALIGLAGPYDVSQAANAAQALFGVTLDEDPDLWAEGNPVNHVGVRPDVDVLLMHGDADDVVPVSFTHQYADALEAAGHETRVEIVPDADHHAIYSANVVGPAIVDWIEKRGTR